MSRSCKFMSALLLVLLALGLTMGTAALAADRTVLGELFSRDG